MKRALITGASQGIGYELALLLAKKGFALTLVGRNEEALKEVTNKLLTKTEVTYFVSDLSQSKDLHILEETVESASFDLIINNAGFGLYGKATDLSIAEQLEMIDVNVKALVALSIKGVQALIRMRKEGVILNVSSAAAFLPTPLMTIYGATKAFVTSFSQGLDFESKELGVRVLASCPGQVATHFSKRASKNEALPKQGYSMSVRRAALFILWQLEHRKNVFIFDWKTRWMIRSLTLLPTLWAQGKVFRSIAKRL